MDMPDDGNSQPNSNSGEIEDASPRWINMVAYVICKRADSRLNDRSAAINNITSNMSRMNELARKKSKDNSGIFKAKDNEIKIVYDEGRDICDNLTICKFLLAVELTNPIDSPEFEKELSDIYAPAPVQKDTAKQASGDEEEIEEEEEEEE